MSKHRFYLSAYVRSWHLLLMLTFSSILPVKADEVLVVTEKLNQFQYKDENGLLTGFAVQVVKKLFEITGHNPKFELLPWARAYKLAIDTPNVMIFTIARSKIREKQFKWVGAIADERLYFWAKKSRVKNSYDSLNQLAKYSIGLTLNSNPHQYLENKDFQNVYVVTRKIEALRMLLNDRVDLHVSTEMGLKMDAKIEKFDPSTLHRILEISELNTQLSIAFNLHSDSGLVSQFQQALNQMHQSGEIKQLQLKWKVPH